jgi:phosphoribosyl 1,2-cyclic phosphodiesterase
MADYVKFLGTAGARFVMARQLRYSAGTLLRLSGRGILLDPGPGSLLRCARSRPRIEPTELDAVILTHAHIDHSGDVNAVLDAMTAGGFRRRGRLFAPAECLQGPDAVVLPYLRDHVARTSVLAPSRHYRLGPVRLSTSVRHRHPAETYGLKFHRRAGMLAFVTDTEYFEGLAESYRDADVLVISVVRHHPHPDGRVMHLCVADARALIVEVRPRLAVLTHFGMTMLEAGPGRVAARLSDELGVKVVAARDGMTLELD